MVNKTILEGFLTRPPYMTQSQNGGKKALFTLEIKTYEEGATTKYIEVECYGKNAEKVEPLKGGETVYVEAKLYNYKSTKYDCYMLAVSADKVEVQDTANAQPKKQIKEQEQQTQQEQNNGVDYDIDFDDLPF